MLSLKIFNLRQSQTFKFCYYFKWYLFLILVCTSHLKIRRLESMFLFACYYIRRFAYIYFIVIYNRDFIYYDVLIRRSQQLVKLVYFIFILFYLNAKANALRLLLLLEIGLLLYIGLCYILYFLLPVVL